MGEGKHRVVLVDDDRRFRRATARLLEDADYHVIECENGVEGFKAVEAALPDLVITDIVMPEMEGLELTLSLRRNFPDLVIIAISGGGRNVPSQYLKMAGSMGATAVLEKPFEPEHLLDLISSSLGEN